MADGEPTITISVEPEVARLVGEAVTRGHYASANDAIRDAFEDFNARQGDLHGLTAEEIERLWDEGIASGPGREVDFEDIKREIIERAGGLQET